MCLFFLLWFFHSFDFVTQSLLNSMYWWRFRLNFYRLENWSHCLCVRWADWCCCCIVVLVLVIDVVESCLVVEIVVAVVVSRLKYVTNEDEEVEKKQKTWSIEYALDLWHSFRLLLFSSSNFALVCAHISLLKHFLIKQQQQKNCSNNLTSVNLSQTNFD